MLFKHHPQFAKLNKAKICNFNEVNLFMSKIQIIGGKIKIRPNIFQKMCLYYNYQKVSSSTRGPNTLV